MWAIKNHFCQLKHQQLDWFGCVTCYDIPFKVISREQVRVGEEVVKSEKKPWNDNIIEWTGCSISKLERVSEDREQWGTLITDASIMIHQ